MTKNRTTPELDLSALRCLLVNFRADSLASTWTALVKGHDFGMQPVFATPDQAFAEIETGKVCVLVIFASETSEQISEVLRAFRQNMGALAAFQMIVCDELTPHFMSTVFEFSVDKFVKVSNWPAETASLSRMAAEVLANKESTEYRTIILNQLIRRGDKSLITKLQIQLKEVADYDHLGAFSYGKALEATGDFEGAAEAYRQAASLNKHFRASHTSLGEALMVTGKLDEAQTILEKLERSNPRDSDRKLLLAAIYTEKREFEKAEGYLKEAAAMAPDNSKIAEAKAHIYLQTGKIKEAFVLMDSMSDVGPFFATKLNDMGIKLSQAGKGKSALELYAKAHGIVRTNLRYKISINAALACHRLGDLEQALVYLARCEQEYGAPVEKAEKIRQAIITLVQKKSMKPAG